MMEFFMIIFVGVLVYIIWKHYKEWDWNRKQPRLVVQAIVVAKREKYSTPHSTTHSTPMHHHHHHDPHDPHDHHHHHFGSSTSSTTTSTSVDYFITFEFGNRERREFEVKEDEYGLIVEQDKGVLTYQGNWYISFVRN